ncbi:MAG TPA: mechanosensitive ion channel [Chloroflexota bacterium]|nr:mechanosensitive ion channel [Chloroflexota bacterium]
MKKNRVILILLVTAVTLLLAGCATTQTTTEPLDLTSPEAISAALQSILIGFFLFLPKMLAAMVLFVITLYLAAWISKLVRHIMEKRRTDPGITLLVYYITRWGIVIVGMITALRQVNFEVTTFLAGLGILGFTLGFALQDISQNVIAGLLLLIQKPFELGDVIQIDEFIGTVLSVDLRTTELRTRDGHNVLIPNAHVFTEPITNFSRQATWRVSLPVGVAYNSDLELVQRVTLRTIQTLPDVLDDPAPTFHFHTFGDYSIDFTLNFWVDSRITNPVTATHPAIIAIQKAYAQAGIEIPYPIQTEIQVEGNGAVSRKP